MTPTERKVELMKRGKRMTAIANELGVHVSHVSHVVNDRRRSPKVEKAVADAIGKPVTRVFGAAA